MSDFRPKPAPASLGLAGVLLFLAFLAACASTPEPAPRPHIPPELAPYFLDPQADYRMAAASELETRVRQAFGVLRYGGDLESARAAIESLAAEEPGFHPARVLLAQLALIDGDAGRARDLLVPVCAEHPGYLPCQMLLGRAAESLGDPVLAFEAYRRAKDGSSVARERMAALEPRAFEITSEHIQGLIDRGHLEEARGELEELETWAGDEQAVLSLWREWALDEGDVEREMEVLSRLRELDPGEASVPERLADLHLISGDIRSALDLLEELVARHGDDPALAEKLERAKFRWRLQLLPQHVQEIASKSVLSRSDLATLLFWLVPAVRYADVTDPPIATDILDHPRRQEILPVMFLGLVPVDENLHRFSPEEPATRVLSLRALLGLVALDDTKIACLSTLEVRSLGQSADFVCRKSAACRLIPEPADCLAQARISGPDALDLFRRTLDLLGPG